MLKTLYLVSEFTIETLQHLSAVNGCSTPVLSYHQMFQFISANIIRESSYPIQIVAIPARISTFGGHRDRTGGREGVSLCSAVSMASSNLRSRLNHPWSISNTMEIMVPMPLSGCFSGCKYISLVHANGVDTFAMIQTDGVLSVIPILQSLIIDSWHQQILNNQKRPKLHFQTW